ncbi:MAG: sialate O-acetylesterase, partial [Planctomycetota bacterium]
MHPRIALALLLLLSSTTVFAKPLNKEWFQIAGYPAFVCEPPASSRVEGKMPWVWYAPTLGKGLPNARDEGWMIERLHARGIAVVGIDVGESYGSPKGRAGYQVFYEHLTTKRGYGSRPVLLARSRGGLMLYSWAVEHPEVVAGVAGIYPVCNVASYPGLVRAAPAFGLTVQELQAKLSEHNPVDRLKTLAAQKVPVLHLQGDSDRVVPLEANSGLLAERYREFGGPVEVEVIEGQGHNMWRGWFESQVLTDFMIARARGWPDFELGTPFSDRMVLQRGMDVPVWGWTWPGEKVHVEFAGQTKSTKANDRGEWSVSLSSLKASATGREFRVTSRGQTTVLKDVLVGEVWFSSGQSNMDWVAGKSSCRDLANRLARAKTDVPIREFNCDIGSSLFPQARMTSKEGWKTSKKASNFSALSLAFAAKLHEELAVPIGILRSTHGATPIETWTAYEGFATHPKLQDVALRVRQSDPTTSDSQKAYADYFSSLKSWQRESAEIMNRGGTALPRPKLPGIADDWKGATRMFNRKIAPLIPFAIRGTIWCQGESNSSDGKIYAAKLEALINGWRHHWKRPDLPFYFTQLQHYGNPDPNQVGFADLREAQTLFYRGAKHVGLVSQHDLNSARPTGIHYFNKLDPGKRLARWALAHEYGRKVSFVGPIYKSHTVEGNKVRIQFEQRGPGGGLMIGNKGLQSNQRKDPSSYVEPARETPNETLKHFRLAGADKVWHAAAAKIVGDSEVVVTSNSVPEPHGVQYAYCATPAGANLYNRAGLPAIPFAFFGGRQMFEEDDAKIVAAKAADQKRRYGKRSYLLPSTLFRDRCVLQRDIAVPVWGHGIPGSNVTVRFGEQTKTAKVDEFERWRVTLDAMPASGEPRKLSITSTAGEDRSVRDVLVGDVWFLTGTRQLDGQLLRGKKGEPATHEALPLVREFRIKTKARRFRSPRKLRMEIGGGRYVASWQAADFDDARDPPSIAAYRFAAKVRKEGVPLGIVTLGAENPPITWVSHRAMQTAKGFEKERDELNLAFPNTEVCKQAVSRYIQTVSAYNQSVASFLVSSREVPERLAEAAPAFPEPYYNQWVSRTETPTHTHNF